MARFQARVGRGLGGVALLFGAIAGLGCSGRENFKCGVPTSDKTKATYCDGANEICVCSERRCARPTTSPACTSGFQYLHPETDLECVDAADLQTKTAANTQDDFCPGENNRPQVCGELVGGAPASCPSGQLCLCGSKRADAGIGAAHVCVRRESRCDATGLGLAHAYDQSCIAGDGDLDSLVLLDIPGTLCPGEVLPRPRCGTTSTTSTAQCGAGEACLCGPAEGVTAELTVPNNTCVRGEPSCRGTSELGLADRFGVCVGGVSDVSKVVLRPANGGLCPGFDIDEFFRDAGTSTSAVDGG